MKVDICHERMAEVKKKRWLVCYFRVQVLKVCLSSLVLATAAIGLKTKEKKEFTTSTTLFAEGNTTDTWDSGKLQKLESERGNSRVWNHPFLAASAAKKFTLMIRILQLVTSGGITIFRTMPLPYIYLIPKLMLSLIFGQSNYTDRKFRPLLPIADFSSWLPLP